MSELQYKIPKEFAKGPVGTWKVTVPDDEMGGARKYVVGIFTGHVADIAFCLGSHYELIFEPVEDLVSTKKLPDAPTEYVAITFPIGSNTWSGDIPNVSSYDRDEYRKRMVHEFLSREPSRFSFRVLDHNHYATFALDRRLCRDPYVIGSEPFSDIKKKLEDGDHNDS